MDPMKNIYVMCEFIFEIIPFRYEINKSIYTARLNPKKKYENNKQTP